MKMFALRGLAAVGLALALAFSAHAQTPRWVGSWASAQMAPDAKNSLAPEDYPGATLRQLVRLSLGGDTLRVRLSNAFGTQPLTIKAARIAASAALDSPRIDPATDRVLTFSGWSEVTIPAGADYWSDPVRLKVAPLTSLAISLRYAAAPDVQTGHPGSRATSYVLPGDHTAAVDMPGAKTADRWFQIAGVDVASETGGAIVALGDSITDGYGVQPNTNLRWTDRLMERLKGRNLGLLNLGIGGNRVLLDGLGPNALARFERDVLSQSGVTHLILLEGVNDLGVLTRDAPATPQAHKALVEQVIAAYRQMIDRARARGIKVIGATILPYSGSAYYHPGPESEADRQAINAWIRAPGNFDGVIDWDAAMRDPARPTHIRPDYDNDGLHPNMAGYRAMADAVPLGLFGLSEPARTPFWKKIRPRKKPVIAVTWDDLPAHAALPPGVTRAKVAADLLEASAKAKAPAFGFINGVLAEREPESAPALALWRQHGQPLGNHTWSHLNLAEATPERFQAEIARNEPMLKGLMGGKDWRWFRYPYLSEGDTVEKRLAVRAWLAANRYKIASVTMSFGDYAFNDPYARCAAMNDQAAIAELERRYLDGAAAVADRARAMSQALHGDDIPYVLLMHGGAFDARMAPRLFKLYQDRGFGFTTLEAAQAHPFYRTDTDPSLPPAPTTLEDALRARGLPVPAFPVDLAALERMCR